MTDIPSNLRSLVNRIRACTGGASAVTDSVLKMWANEIEDAMRAGETSAHRLDQYGDCRNPGCTYPSISNWDATKCTSSVETGAKGTLCHAGHPPIVYYDDSCPLCTDETTARPHEVTAECVEHDCRCQRPTTSQDMEDAAKWRALRNCARMTGMGSAGLGHETAADYAHVTLNFWTCTDNTYGGDPGPEWAREWLDQFVVKALRAQQSKASVPTTSASTGGTPPAPTSPVECPKCEDTP